MNAPALSRRLLPIIGLVFCAALLALARGVPALRRWYELERTNAVELAQSVWHARNSIATLGLLADSLRARRTALDSLQLRLFSGATINSAASNAGAHVTNVARASNVELGALQISVDTVKAALRRITVTASARSDIHGLLRMLASLETGKKLMRVTALSVSQADVAGRSDAAESLNIQFTLQALAQGRSK